MLTTEHPPRLPRAQYLLQLGIVLAFVGAFLSIMSAHETVNAGWGPKLFLVGRMAFLVLLCTWFLRRSGERWRDVGFRRPSRWWMVPLLVVGGFALLLLLATQLRTVVFPALGVEPANLSPLTGIRGDFGEYLFYATVVSWGTAAFGEEMVMRGFILDRLAKVTGLSGTPSYLLAIPLQAALFGAFHLHQGIGGVLLTGTVGLVFGLIWLIGGRNLWAGILLHGLIDFINHTEFYSG